MKPTHSTCNLYLSIPRFGYFNTQTFTMAGQQVFGIYYEIINTDMSIVYHCKDKKLVNSHANWHLAEIGGEIESVVYEAVLWGKNEGRTILHKINFAYDIRYTRDIL